MRSETRIWWSGFCMGTFVFAVLYYFLGCGPRVTRYDLPHKERVPNPTGYYKTVWGHDTCWIKGQKVICRDHK